MQSVEEKQTKTGFLKEGGVINWCEMMKSSNLSGLVCLKKERSCRLLRSLSLNSSADDTLNVFRTFFFNQKMNLSVRSSIISTAGAHYTTLASGDDIGTGIVGHHRHHRAPPTPSLCTPSHVATSNDASSLLERFHSLSFTVCR